MTLFQILLILSLVVFVVYMIKFKNATYDRLFMVVLGITGIVLVLYPELSTKIANFLNIGRGTDLVFYVWIIFSLFKFLRYEARINELTKNTTELIRQLAINNARIQNKNNKNSFLGEY